MEQETKAKSESPVPGTQHPSRKRSRKRLWTLAGFGIVIAAGGGWVVSEGANAPGPAQKSPLPSVTVTHPLVRNLDTRTGFLGQFSAIDKVDLRAQVGGTLTGIHFKDGEVVQKGQLLFTIESRPYDIRLAQARAQLESAQAKSELAARELKRADELRKSEAGTVQNVEQRSAEVLAARAAVDDARAQIRDAEFDVEHCRIVAPFTGRIGMHLVSVGNLVAGSRAATSPTTLLASLVSLDPIYLNFDMSESDYQSFAGYRAANKAETNNAVELGTGSDAGFPRRGTLDFVNNELDRASGTIKARATVPNPGLTLIPGEFSRIRIVVARASPTLLLPDAVVRPDQSQHDVLTVTPDGTVLAKQVEVGDLRGGLRVIRSGLTPDDEVIIGGLAFAQPGSKVTMQRGEISFAAGLDQD